MPPRDGALRARGSDPQRLLRFRSAGSRSHGRRRCDCRRSGSAWPTRGRNRTPTASGGPRPTSLDTRLDATQRGLVEVIVGGAVRLPELLGWRTGSVDLVVIGANCCRVRALHTPTRPEEDQRIPKNADEELPRARAARRNTGPSAAAVPALYNACLAVLQPGGLLVTIAADSHARGDCVDGGRPVSSWHSRPGSAICSTSSPCALRSGTGYLAPDRRPQNCPSCRLPGTGGSLGIWWCTPTCSCSPSRR